MPNDMVSVIMPVYNSRKHISEAIDSVLKQSHKHLELIVIDDASTDDSLQQIDVFQDDRLKRIRLEKNIGAGKARNEGIRRARGRYIAFIDADDIWLQEKLSAQIAFMKEKNASLSYTDYFLMDDASNFSHRVLSPPWVDRQKMERNNYIGCLTAVYDTHVLGKIYMPERRKRQDWALWLDILTRIDRALGLQIPLAAYRQTQNSLSRNKLGLMRENYAFYREVLGLGTIHSGLYLVRFLGAYSWHKMTSIKSID